MTTDLKPLRVLYHSAACIRPAAIATVPQDGRSELIADLSEHGAPYARLLAEAPAMLEALREMTAIVKCIGGSFALRGEYGWEKHDEAELDKAEEILARIDKKV